jgi:hypothetical protein
MHARDTADTTGIDDDHDTACVAGDPGCPGPGSDDLPCLDCFIAARCQYGSTACDGPDTDASAKTLCVGCAIREAGGITTLRL